jgi:serine/threonine protein phosphatase PrpC
MKVRVGVRTDVGRIRERNEDAYLIREPLFAVADGMGGHRGGDVASSMIVDALERAEVQADAPLSPLVDLIKKANHDVLERGDADEGLKGMGTTLTAVVTDEAKAYLAHIGDSRAYLLREGALQRLTRDHTLVERMVEEGRLEPDQARNHPQQNILTRVLGVEDEIEVDDLTLDPMQPGDRILLCTDGLNHMVDDDTIEGILQEENDPQAAADRLVDAAIEAGGEDNVTVVVLDFVEGDGSGRGRRAGGATSARSEPAGEGSESQVAEAEHADEETDEDEGAPSGGLRRRILVWTAVAVVVVVAALIGVRVYVSQQWYVGESAGRVAIYNGIPTEVLGFNLSHVEETTTLSAAEVEQVPFWSDLENGITAGSLEEAQRIVSQIEEDLAARQPDTGGGTSPGETPSGGASP